MGNAEPALSENISTGLNPGHITVWVLPTVDHVLSTTKKYSAFVPRYTVVAVGGCGGTFPGSAQVGDDKISLLPLAL